MTVPASRNEIEARLNRYLVEEPDAALRQQLEYLWANASQESNLLELNDRLLEDLKFGTAGLRAKMQAGYKRMNRVTVVRATWALCQHLASVRKESDVGQKVQLVVGFDARLHSREFAEEVASVASGLGLTVFVFDEEIPTPLCGFAVDELKAQAGVMITASHNPRDDNGYKVYWANGAQIIAPHDKEIERWIGRAPLYGEIKRAKAGLKNAALIKENLFKKYFARIRKNAWKEPSGPCELSIVYTPLHGVGNKFFLRAMKESGFVNIHVVASQAEPNGLFPTIEFPNPEEKGTLDAAISLAQKLRANLVLANDPDADRLAVVCRDEKKDQWLQLSGNEIGILLGDAAIAHSATKKKRLVLSTIVSSPMLSKIAAERNVVYAETLTGFANIANLALAREKGGAEEFIFGFEEALGYCVGNAVRDKDGISAALRFAEMTANLHKDKRSVIDALDDLSLKFGVYRSRQGFFRYDGPGAFGRMTSLMHALRAKEIPMSRLANVVFTEAMDLLDGQKRDLPPADVLIYKADKLRLVIRPSGTEPKMKYYLDLHSHATRRENIDEIRRNLDKNLDAIEAELRARLER